MDVLVTDGFVGNVSLKISEGLGQGYFQDAQGPDPAEVHLQDRRPADEKDLHRPAKKMSSDEYGGAPLLGVNGVVLICHGKANPRTIFRAIENAYGPGWFRDAGEDQETHGNREGPDSRSEDRRRRLK